MAVKHILWFVIMIVAGLCSMPLWLLKMAIQCLVKALQTQASGGLGMEEGCCGGGGAGGREGRRVPQGRGAG